jgi:DNA-binding Xre family transcriptional regulator
MHIGSLSPIAKETGISYNTLFNIKKGEVTSISFDALEKLSKKLECTPNDLLAIKR